MGAWDFIRPHLAGAARAAAPCAVSRVRAARVPPEGSAPRHALNQQALVEAGIRRPSPPRPTAAWPKRADSQLTAGSSRGRSAGVSTAELRRERVHGEIMPSNIVVPEVGESIVDARVAKWLQQGRRRRRRRRSARRARDRQNRSRGRGAAGRRPQAHRSRSDGEDVKVGEVLGVIDDAAARERRQRTPALRARRASAAEAGSSARKQRPQPKAAAARRRVDADGAQGGEEKAVDLARVRGSGDAGRVMRRDVAGGGRRREGAARVRQRQRRRARGRHRAKPGRAPRRPVAEVPAVQPGRAHRRAHPHVEAARDDRAPARRGAEHRGDAHDLQRGRHDGGDGAARAPQAVVQGTPRRRPRHRVVLRQGVDRRAA